jgi:hypothetical protein
MATEEKVELSEQTPLNPAEFPPLVETTTIVVSGEQPVVHEEKERKKWWFGKKGKKTETRVTDEKEVVEKEGTVDNGGEPKAKKPHWWQRKPGCKAACTEGTTFGIDYARRDEQQLQTAIDLTFADIFGEPDALHSLNGVWRVTHSIFTAVRCFFYKLFSIIIFIPAAIIFGVLFALVSALGVYVVIPTGRLFSIPATWIFKLWNYIVSGILEPLGVGIASIFSRIRIYRYGINNDPTATIGA